MLAVELSIGLLEAGWYYQIDTCVELSSFLFGCAFCCVTNHDGISLSRELVGIVSNLLFLDRQELILSKAGLEVF
jgi:hypothetical protein